MPDEVNLTTPARDRSPTASHWFEPVADYLGDAYLRYSFTKGTEQEVAFLWAALGLAPGADLLDVGCGPGRHAHALARRGAAVLGIDISARFVELARRDAPPGARFERGDARGLGFDDRFDAVISLCQGAFGLGRDGPESGDRSRPPAGPDPDEQVLAGIGRALRPGGRAAVSAFSSYFQVRWLEETDTFDAATGLNHEDTVIRDEHGSERAADVWTTCFTPRELRLLAERVGLRVRHVWSVTPGSYAARPPDVDRPEFLLLAEKPI